MENGGDGIGWISHATLIPLVMEQITPFEKLPSIATGSSGLSMQINRTTNFFVISSPVTFWPQMKRQPITLMESRPQASWQLENVTVTRHRPRFSTSILRMSSILWDGLYSAFRLAAPAAMITNTIRSPLPTITPGMEYFRVPDGHSREVKSKSVLQTSRHWFPQNLHQRVNRLEILLWRILIGKSRTWILKNSGTLQVIGQGPLTLDSSHRKQASHLRLPG